jgi:hypothetical protein
LPRCAWPWQSSPRTRSLFSPSPPRAEKSAAEPVPNPVAATASPPRTTRPSRPPPARPSAPLALSPTTPSRSPPSPPKPSTSPRPRRPFS